MAPGIIADEREGPRTASLSGVPRSDAGRDVELLAGYLVGLRANYEGRPLRWSPTVVVHLLLDLAPRKLLLDSDQAAALPAVVRSFVRFAGGRTGLDDPFVEETLATIDEVEHEFLDRVGGPAAAGPAKTVLAMLQAQGVDLNDLDAINAALEDGMPMRLPEPAPKHRRSTAAAPAEVVTASERAPILTRIDILTGFYGDGRKAHPDRPAHPGRRSRARRAAQHRGPS